MRVSILNYKTIKIYTLIKLMIICPYWRWYHYKFIKNLLSIYEYNKLIIIWINLSALNKLIWGNHKKYKKF